MSPGFKIADAYRFASEHGLESEVQEIRAMRIHPDIGKRHVPRKGALVELFEAKNLIDEFVRLFWQERFSQQGDARRRQYLRLKNRNHALLTGAPIDEDTAEDPFVGEEDDASPDSNSATSAPKQSPAGIPKLGRMLRPVLQLAANGPITRGSATAAMISHFNLSSQDQAALIPSGGTTYVHNRTGWAMTFLTKASLIERVAPRQYRATDLGREFLITHPDAISEEDLKQVPGWHEAWHKNTASDADAPDSDDDPADAEARIERKIRAAIAGDSNRSAVLGFLAWAVENADEERPDAWTLEERSRGLQLTTGRLLAVRLKPGTIEVSVVGPISSETRAALGAREEDDDVFRNIEGGVLLLLPVERAADKLDLLRDPFAKFVDAAMARVRRTVSLEDHSPDAVAYLSKSVGRDLPQPEERKLAADDDTDDDVDNDVEASREPKARGRAPIFEHGQRAIGPLMEDIDPEHGVVALPDLQRPFVWEDKKVRDLLDSLFIGFPVGTLVLWHTSDEREARAMGSASRALRATTLVIDGQQRLTSLYSVMRGREIEDKDGVKRAITIAFRPRDGRFEVADAAIRQDPEFLVNVTELWMGPRLKSQIRRDLIAALQARGRVVDDVYADAVEQNLERAQAIRDYRFPTVELRKTVASEEIKEEDVADIFVRINNQGTKLGQADFVLTLLSVFHGELRDRIEVRSREMSQQAVVPVDTQQILRTACAVGFGRARMSAVYKYLRGVDPTTGDLNPSRRMERLATLDDATDDCLDPTSWRDYMLRVKHAGFVAAGLVASTNAVTNAYAFYVLGRKNGVPKQVLDETISRWLFGTLLTARYSASSETRFEEDLARVRDSVPGQPQSFISALDSLLADLLTSDFWTRTLSATLETQRGRSPAALAFRAAQIILGARVLFGDQRLHHLLSPSPQAGRSASEMHHLFPKAWLARKGITDRKRVNQVANLADVGWYENSVVGSEGPKSYVPRLRDKMGINDDRWGRMCAEHGLPIGWESMEYEDFLAKRRPRMAEIVRIAYRQLGGESDAAPLAPPWFLPGAELVWQRIGEAERALRRLIRSIYGSQFGAAAGSKIQESLDAPARDALNRALRSRPEGADPLSVVDYLYLGQLPPLLFGDQVWTQARKAFVGDDPKRQLQSAIDAIAPVRNEIAHVREVTPERLQRANLACGEVLTMLGQKTV